MADEDEMLAPYGADPFAMSPPPPAGYRGYDYKPSMTPLDIARAMVPPGSRPRIPSAKSDDYWRVPSQFELAAMVAGPRIPGNLLPRLMGALPDVPVGGRTLPSYVVRALDPTGPGVLRQPSITLVPRTEVRRDPEWYGMTKPQRLERARLEGASTLAARLPATHSDLTIMRDRQPIGGIDYTLDSRVDPRRAYIDWFWNNGPALSTRELRELRESFRSLHPTVKEFEGARVSGAREVHGKPDRRVGVRMNALGPALSAPALAAALAQYGDGSE